MAKQNHISKEDIKRYLEGSLGPEKSHEIERISMENPLLIEALEGLEGMKPDDLEKHLEDITQRLGLVGKEESQSTVSWKVVGVAASIGLMALVGYFIWSPGEKVTEQEIIALNQSQPEEIPVEEEFKEEQQQGLVEEYLDSQPEIVSEESANLIAKTESSEQSAGGFIEESKLSIPEEEPPKKSESQVNIIAATEELDFYELEETEVAGEISDQQVTTSSITYNEANVSAEETADVAEVYQEPVAVQTEVKSRMLVSRYSDSEISSRSKKESIAGKSLPGSIPEPYPENGFEGLNQYLEKYRKIKTPGYAIIEFQVKENSRLSNFEIIEETKEGLGKEAIRLLKEGPNWFPAIEEGVAVKKDVQLKIEF